MNIFVGVPAIPEIKTATFPYAYLAFDVRRLCIPDENEGWKASYEKPHTFLPLKYKCEETFWF